MSKRINGSKNYECKEISALLWYFRYDGSAYIRPRDSAQFATRVLEWSRTHKVFSFVHIASEFHTRELPFRIQAPKSLSCPLFYLLYQNIRTESPLHIRWRISPFCEYLIASIIDINGWKCLKFPLKVKIMNGNGYGYRFHVCMVVLNFLWTHWTIGVLAFQGTVFFIRFVWLRWENQRFSCSNLYLVRFVDAIKETSQVFTFSKFLLISPDVESSEQWF